MKDLLLVLPLLLPLLGGLLSFFLRRSPLGDAVALASAVAQLGLGVFLLGYVQAEGIQSTALGGWPAPFGIVLVLDTFAALMVFTAALVGLAVTLYSLRGIDSGRKSLGYFAFLQFMLFGVQGAFLTGDVFNLYVWLEVMLLSSFVLLTLGGERAQLLGGFKYFSLNFLSSLFYLMAAGLLYGLTGSLNLADLHLRMDQVEPARMSVVAGFFLLALSIKAALFPLFFWLPASYHTPPLPVAAFFAALPTKVAVYALFRLFTVLFHQEPELWHRLILWIAGFTMVTGVLGALAQMEVRRLLSFHIISQIGYMIMGLGLFTPLGIAGGIFYIVHHIFVKAALFLVAGLAQRLLGSFHLEEMGGLYRLRPYLALLFIVPALSLAGVPPFSGFFAKLFLVVGGMEIGEYAIVGVSLLVGLFTLMSMMKIWREAFWKPLPQERQEALLRASVPRTMVVGTALLSFITVFIGLGAGYGFTLAERAASELLDPSDYIKAVLGGGR
ncbi:MAG: proton-conducting transporter membrane subunit [Thermus sp.]|nr:proton-conducting transporter membrane subunit [Thermus sp.]